MTQIKKNGILILVAVLFTAVVSAQPAVTASDAWLTASASDGAAYMSISNPTMYDVYLVSATTAVAEKVELRESEKVLKEITIPSFGSIELKPGATFLRLSNLKRPLKVGETIEIVLETDAGIVFKVQAPVKRS